MSDSSSGNTKTGGIPVWFEGDVAHIDVCGLEPPRPLVAILELIASAETGDKVIVIIDRNPLLLYSELEERGWTWKRLAADPGKLRLCLVKENAA